MHAEGLRSYLDPSLRLEPRPRRGRRRGRRPLVSSPACRSRLCHGATPQGNGPDFIKGRLKARGGHLNRDLFSLRGCWTDYNTASSFTRNDDVMLSVFAKSKHQFGKGDYVLSSRVHLGGGSKATAAILCFTAENISSALVIS